MLDVMTMSERSAADISEEDKDFCGKVIETTGVIESDQMMVVTPLGL